MIPRIAPLFLTTIALAQEPAVVRTVIPAPATAASPLQIPGRTEPIEQARIVSRATGVVKERTVDIGDRVKEGDTLAVIDIPEILQQLEAAKASRDQAVARADTARLAATRAGKLLDQKALSSEDAEQRMSLAAITDAALRTAEAEVKRLETIREFSVVRAPFPATIAARRIDRGDFVKGDSGSADWAFHLVRLDKLRFTVAATPDIALRLSKEAAATITFAELPGRDFPATVSRSSRLFDTTSGTMRVELLLENPDLTLPAGLTGKATFVLPPPPGTWLLPNNSLVLREGKPLVAIIKDGKLAFIDVLPGRNLGSKMEITSSAISAQTAVVVSLNAMLRAGDPVKASPLEGGR
ncbi:MAG: efflux RND transporter periplasmic adaptor subunit [Verrucomicrobia bacterium]|nr:efflux RND transporter periplasmic adaptor subunit [Verrucomicrobiota bacterium]